MREKSVAYGVLTISYSGLIFVLSAQPNPAPVLPFTQADKLLHALEFGLLSYFLFQAFFNSLSFPGHKVAWLVLSLTLLYAITDEYHQSFVSGRYADLWDIVADLSGAILVQWAILNNHSQRRLQR